MITTAERWISQGNDNQIFDQIVAKDSTEDNKIFSIVDRFTGLLKPRIGWGVQDIFNRCQGSITEKYGVYDAKAETEKRDLIERLKEEIMKMDTNNNPHTFTSVGELEQ